MRRIIFFAIICVFASVRTLADDKVSGTLVGPSTDNEWTLDVNLTNQTTFIAFQMDVTLPSGVTAISATPVTSRLAKGDDITISGQTQETPFIVSCDAVASKKNCYRVTGYNIGNHPIQGTSGSPIVRILLQTEKTMAASEMGASFDDVDFIKTTFADNSLADAKGTTEHLTDYLKITALEDGTTKISKKGSPSATLQYATAHTGWQDYNFGSDISITKGNSIWFRAKGNNGRNDTFCEESNGFQFSSSNDIAASQNIMSLLDASCQQTSVPEYAFYGLFQDCKYLSTVPELPATTLNTGCYYSMFQGCSSLTSIPDLSHAHCTGDIECFGMFFGCSSLNINTIGPGTEWRSPTFEKTSFHMLNIFGNTKGNFTESPSNGSVYYVADKPYTRSLANQWGTIVLPFDIPVSDTDSYSFYNLTGISDQDIVLTKITGTLPAGTPALIYMEEASKSTETGNYELSLTADMAYSTVIHNPDAVSGLTLTGVYTSTDITDNEGYIISNNAFWNIQSIKGSSKVYCSPFRAYLAGAVSNNARSLGISLDEDIVTTISDTLNSIPDGSLLFDLNGHRLNDLQPGVNIVKFSNGTTRKIIIK